MASSVVVTFYTRKGCHLCDIAIDLVEDVLETDPFELVVRDVDTDPSWRKAYGGEVPVVFVGEHKAFRYRVDPDELRALIRAAAAAGGGGEGPGA